MGLSSIKKLFPCSGPRRVAAVTGSEAAPSSDGFASIVAAEPHHNKSDCSSKVLQAKTACPSLKSKMLALLWRSGRTQKTSSQDAATVRNHAWLPHDSSTSDSPCTDACSTRALAPNDKKTEIMPEPHQQENCHQEGSSSNPSNARDINQHDASTGDFAGPLRAHIPEDASSAVEGQARGVTARVDRAADFAGSSSASVPQAETPDAEVEQKSLAELAREARKIEGQSLAEIAAEACELARQEMGSLLHEQVQELPQQQPREQEAENCIEDLEREWANSMFANFDENQQRQLRRVIGLPAQPYYK